MIIEHYNKSLSWIKHASILLALMLAGLSFFFQEIAGLSESEAGESVNVASNNVVDDIRG